MTSLYDQAGRGRRRRGVLLAVVVLVVAGAAGAWWLLRDVPEDPAIAAQALAETWSQGRLASAPFDDRAPTDLSDRYTGLTEGLDADPPDVEVLGVDPPAADDDPLATRARLRVAWDLAGTTWEYRTTAILGRAEDDLEWRVAWEPALVHPRLTSDLALVARRVTPPRAEVVAEDGTALVTDREVIDVGVEPRRVEDLDRLVADLADELEDTLDVTLDRADLARRVQEADETAFVPVVTLRAGDYGRVQDVIRPLPGTVFRSREVPLAPTRGFARYTLGTAGPVTAEMLEEHPDRYAAGDVAGRSGLQEAYDERLFGDPGVEVRLSGGQPPADPVLFTEPPQPGEPVTVTLDPEVQRAADAALSQTEFAGAVAVVRPSDGHVLALANSEQATFDIARSGQLPPGSTFKVVTTAALLDDTDLSVDTAVDCPGEVTIGGRVITNAESQELGTVPFRTAFVNSCNTAFVQLAQELSPTSLRDAAARFGIGDEPALGLSAFAGEVPTTTDPVDLAVAAIGQGRNLVSPLLMAGVMATVAEGRHPGLALVLEPEPEAVGSPPDPLGEDVASTLRQLTRGVVEEGTGTALRDTPGGPVHGKTGTAEFSSDGELRTHAWFVGYQDDLALAVVVTDTPGRYGGQVAAPIARELLTRLADAS